MIQKAFNDKYMGKTQMKVWYKQFKDGGTSVDSAEDCRFTVAEVESDIGILKTSVSRAVDLKMTLVCAKFTPKLFEDRFEVTQANLEVVTNDDVFRKIVTGDESWMIPQLPTVFRVEVSNGTTAEKITSRLGQYQIHVDFLRFPRCCAR